jgi:hypothetical protein
MQAEDDILMRKKNKTGERMEHPATHVNNKTKYKTSTVDCDDQIDVNLTRLQ